MVNVMRHTLLAVLSLCFGLLGCARDPQSAIVARAEQAGAGRLTTVSTEAMQQWLAGNREVAKEIDAMCAPVRKEASAEWPQSTEGRLCSAARSQAFFNGGPVKGDGKAYGPGAR